MTALNQFKLKKIKEVSPRILKVAAEHLFFSSLILILISLLLGSVVFYKYNILPRRVEPALGEVTRFNENIYQKIIEAWHSRGEVFEATENKEYPDPFK